MGDTVGALWPTRRWEASTGGKVLLGLRNNRIPDGPLYCMGCHPEFGNKTGMGLEITFAD